MLNRNARYTEKDLVGFRRSEYAYNDLGPYTIYFRSFTAHFFPRVTLTPKFILQAIVYRMGDAMLFYGLVLVVLARFFKIENFSANSVIFSIVWFVFIGWRAWIEYFNARIV